MQDEIYKKHLQAIKDYISQLQAALEEMQQPAPSVWTSGGTPRQELSLLSRLQIAESISFMEEFMQNKADIVELKAEARALCRSVSKHIQGLDEDISRLIDIIDSMNKLQLRPEISSYLSELSASLCWPFGDLDAMQSRLEELEKNIEEYENWFKKSPN